MSEAFKNMKPYALIELSEAQNETHIIIFDKHYEFSNVWFYVDADLAIDRSESLEAKGVKTLLLNNHALMAEFWKYEVDCASADLGISVNYKSEQ
ncbi:hypothetical protein [Acinetobacter soli]|uniref:hypothetical protein n=1 Tax=Acinetobacter soli TaxID=487316 RepID=UPI00124EC0E2|nr:hypothetical protein [Acinetobacter soli]